MENEAFIKQIEESKTVLLEGNHLFLPFLEKLVTLLQRRGDTARKAVNHMKCLQMIIDHMVRKGMQNFIATGYEKIEANTLGHRSVYYTFKLDIKVDNQHVWAVPYSLFGGLYPDYANCAQVIVEEDLTLARLHPEDQHEWTHVMVIPDSEVGDSYCNNFSQYIKPGAASILRL